MRRNALFGLVVLLAASASLDAAGAKRLDVQPFGGLAGRAVEFCLPLAEGELDDAAAVRVLSGGQEIPTQVTTLSTWPKDKSPRVLWVRALPSDPKAALSVEYGEGIARAQAKTLLAVAKDDEGVTVESGSLRLRLAGDSLKLIEQAWFDRKGDGKFSEPVMLLDAPGIVPRLVTLAGKSYAPVGPPRLTVEESGPVCAVIRIKGRLAPVDKPAADSTECFEVSYRLKVYAGSSAVFVEHVLRRPGRPFTFPMPKQADAEKEFALLVPVDAWGLTMKLRSEAGKLSYAFGGAGKTIEEKSLEGGQRKLVIGGGEFAAYQPTVRFDAGGRQTPGTLSWLDVAGGPIGVSLAVRDAAIAFPKAFEFQADGVVSVDLWKDDPSRAALEVGSGFQRVHDLVMYFHADKPRQATGEWAEALCFPARGVVPAEQFRASGVFGPLPKSLDALPPGFEELSKTLVARDSASRILSGDQAYGSTLLGAPRPDGRMGYAGGAYNSLSVRGALFALFGAKEYYDDVDRMGRWTRDWDMKHRALADGTPIVVAAEPGNSLVLFIPTALGGAKDAFPGQNELFKALGDKKRVLGCIQLASWCRGGPCQRSRDISVEGMLYHYYLTGDPESLEAAREAANNFRWLVTCKEDLGNPNHLYIQSGAGHRFHVGGKFMLQLMVAYEGTGDKSYLDAVGQLWKFMLDATKLHKEPWPRDDALFWSGTAMASWPYQTTNFTRPAYLYYRYTGDATIRDYAEKLASAVVAERFDAERKQFFKGIHSTDVGQDKIVKGRIYLDSRSLAVTSGVGWSYLMTPKKEQMDAVRAAYAFSADRFKEMQAVGRFDYDVNAGNLMTSFQGLLGAWEAAGK